MQEGDEGGGNISIGEEDQLRDREMLDELLDEDGSGEQRKPSKRAAPSAPPSAPKAGSGDEWQPGDAEQPWQGGIQPGLDHESVGERQVAGKHIGRHGVLVPCRGDAADTEHSGDAGRDAGHGIAAPAQQNAQ